MSVGQPPFEIYQEELSSLYHGHALWSPNPVESLYSQVSIGDVGFISNGAFVRMFNVTIPWNHWSNRRLAEAQAAEPEQYDSLTFNPGTDASRTTFSKLDHYSPRVSKEENAGNTLALLPEQAEGVTYKCQGRGALLSLPRGGRREDVIRTRVFEDYVRDHVVYWFNWARNARLPVEQMEDLILVTGCTLVTSWAVAVFDDINEAQVSLIDRAFNNEGAGFLWRNIRGTVKCQDSQLDPYIPSVPQNHCIFIRGFRSKRIFYLNRPIHAAAEPPSYDRDDSDDPDKFSDVRKGGHFRKYRSPPSLSRILHYIAKKCLERGLEDANAEGVMALVMAIVHDDDLQLINLETLTPDALTDAVEKFLGENNVPVLIKNGAATLQDDDMRKRSLDIRMKYLADFMGDKTEGFIQGSPVSAYPLADFIPSRPKSGDNTKGLIQGNPLSAYSLATPPMTPQSPSDNWNIWRNVL